MKIWFNKISESRRSMVEVPDTEITVGRDPEHRVPRKPAGFPAACRGAALDGRLQLENMGLNSCIVGDEEVLGGQSPCSTPGAKVRIWPFSLTFEAEKKVTVQPRRPGGPPPLA